MPYPPHDRLSAAWKSKLAELAPGLARPDHHMFPPLGKGERARVAAEAMDLGVEFLNFNQLDHAIGWFTHAVTWGYPGATQVRDTLTQLRDTLAFAEIDHLVGNTPHTVDLGEAAQAVIDSLLDAACAAAQLRDQAPPQ